MQCFLLSQPEEEYSTGMITLGKDFLAVQPHNKSLWGWQETAGKTRSIPIIKSRCSDVFNLFNTMCVLTLPFTRRMAWMLDTSGV